MMSLSLSTPVDTTALRIDPAEETSRITEAIREHVFGQLRRKGSCWACRAGSTAV